MDNLTPEKRSWNMRRIKSKNTKPEMAVRSSLHTMGYRFRLHRKDLPGKPDIILPKYSTAIFVHGCFWHRHKDCKYASNPKTRKKWWQAKFARNVERDCEVRKEMKELGWRVLIVWECELRDQATLAKRLKRLLKSRTGVSHLIELPPVR